MVSRETPWALPITGIVVAQHNPDEAATDSMLKTLELHRMDEIGVALTDQPRSR